MRTRQMILVTLFLFALALALGSARTTHAAGKADVVQYISYTGHGWDVLQSTGSSFTASAWNTTELFNSNPLTRWVAVGDFNGDGKKDVVQYISYAGHGWDVLQSTGSSFTASAWNTTELFNSDNSSRWVGVGDFNGDGKEDVVQYIAGRGWDVLLSTGSSFTASTWNATEPFNSDNTSRWVAVGDFNGDGKADVVQYLGVGGLGWRVLLSTGSSFIASTWNNTELFNSDPITRWVAVGDFNGDGKADVVQYISYAGHGWDVLRSTGSSFVESTWNSTELFNPDAATRWVGVGNFNGN